MQCLGPGVSSNGRPISFGDTLGAYSYDYQLFFCPVVFALGNDYVPGDANMLAGQWPPQVIGSDVTYLVNYFRGVLEPCLIGDFYCSGDANGDCQVISSDVTRMVAYFRGLASLSYCPDYEPSWLIPDDFPVNPPSGWPVCE